MRKLISVLLALCVITTTLLISYSAAPAIEVFEIDLTKSSSLGDSAVNLTEFETGPVNASFAPGWFPCDNAVTTDNVWPDAIISLKYSDGNFATISAGYTYAINVKYTVTKANQTPQISIGYNDTDNGTQLDGFHTLAVSEKHGAAGVYTLSAITDGIAQRPLRVAFGGAGKITIESIVIQRVGSSASVMTVSYVDEGRTTKEFSTGDFKTPVFNGAISAVFGGWYTDAAFENKATTPVEGGTYYARWASVKRAADLKNANRMAGSNNGENDGILKLYTATDSDPMKVVVNKAIDGDVRIGGYGHDGSAQRVTLEYFDYDPEIQDGVYNGYVTVKAGRQCSVTVSYKVTQVTERAQISIIASAKSLSWENSMPIVALNDNITQTGSYTLESGPLFVGEHGISADDRLSLGFEGYGTFEIESIIIEEVTFTNDQVLIQYDDGDDSFSEYVKIGDPLSDPKDLTGFYGWYKDKDFIGKANVAEEARTVYAKRDREAYSFILDFDEQSSKDFYVPGEHTLSDWSTVGGKGEVATGAGIGGTDAVRLTYQEIDGDKSDYATNPLMWIHDTNIKTGDKIAKRFMGVPETTYLLSLKYKVEETDGKSLELYVGKRNKSQSATGHINDFGSGAWQIMDTAKIGDTITETTDGWVSAKVYFTARDSWIPIILLKTNNQKSRTDHENPLASVLIDDVEVTEVVPIISNTQLGIMTYEDYEVKKYDSSTSDSIIGNKNGLEVSSKINHTPSGDKSLKLTIQSDSSQYTGNTVISFNKEPFRTTKGASYVVRFWVMSESDLDEVIWSVNSVAGAYSSVTSKHQIETRDKVDLKSNVWTEIIAYIPKLQSIPDEISMLSVAMAANGYDGKSIYIDDISVEQIVESQSITFADSSATAPFTSFFQRAFAGQKINTLPSVSKDGYLFNGWFDETGREYKVSDIFPADKESITLYADWISTADVQPKNFTAGSFDPEIYDEGVIPYENVCETEETPVYGIANVGSTQSCAWTKSSGMYGNGTADSDGTLILQNDIYSKFTDTQGRNAIALVNEDGTRFMVVKGQKYTIKYDYMNGSNQGTSVIQTYISTESGYGTFGNNQGQALKHIAVHGTDYEYKTYQEFFVADFTGYVYLTFTARSDDGNPHTTLYHKVYVDNLEITFDDDVKKINFIVESNVFKTCYGKAGDDYPVFDVIQGDNRTTEFDGFYTEPEFVNRITEYKFTDQDEQNVYIKYKEVEYSTPSDFSSPIILDFEETDILDDYYRQGKHMTYWSRGELNPEWQFVTNDSDNANSGNNYIRLNGYSTYWNKAKLVLYDINNPSGTMLLKKGETYRVKIMTRCEDMYDTPSLTITLEDPIQRYISQDPEAFENISLVYDDKETANGYMCFFADITVPETFDYFPELAIRKNANDLQTLFIDTVQVEMLIDCTVTFDSDGGTEFGPTNVQIHDNLYDPGLPFKDGFDFDGWFTEKGYKNKWDFDNDTVESDMTLYAKWSVAKQTVDNTPTTDETVAAPSIKLPIKVKIDNGKSPVLLDADSINIKPSGKVIEETADDTLPLWTIILITLGALLLLFALISFVIILIKKRSRKQAESNS